MSKFAEEKRGILFLVFVMSVSIVIYGGVVFLVTSAGRFVNAPDRMGSVRPVVWLLSLALLALAAWKVPQVAAGASRDGLLPGPEFRARIFVAMICSEGAAVLGLVLAFVSHRFSDFAVPAGAALLLIGAHVTPTTLRYFAERARAERG